MLRIGILASVVLFSAATLLPAQEKPATEDDYYRLLTFTVPKGVVLEAGAFAFLPENKVVVSSRRGEIYLIENAYSKNPAKVTFKRYAHGLHEVLGLDYRDGWLYVTQRPEVSRIKDTTGDGKADLIAGAFVLVACRIHALGNIHRLGVHMHINLGIFPVEAVLFVTDVLDSGTGDFFHHVFGDGIGAANFTGQHDPVGGAERLNRDPR